MPEAPKKQVIQETVRQYSPVNKFSPRLKMGFFVGFLAVLVICVLVVLTFALIGWLGELLFNLSWWDAQSFMMIALIINLFAFPVYIAGVLSDFSIDHYGRFKLYAFLYAFLAIAVPSTFNMYGKEGFDFSIWPYIWSTIYGLYSLWLAKKMNH